MAYLYMPKFRPWFVLFLVHKPIDFHSFKFIYSLALATLIFLVLRLKTLSSFIHLIIQMDPL